MKKIFQYKSLLWAACFAIACSFQACETTDFSITDDPNNLSDEAINPDFLLNAVQQDFPIMVNTLGEAGAEMTRILNLAERNYQNAYLATEFDNEWTEAYQQMLSDIRALTPISEETERFHHIGMAQVLESYIMVTLVDLFGDVPYSEAIQGLGNLNPDVDSGADIYNEILTLLDKAIENFGKDVAFEPQADLYYGRDWDKWVDLANTLKMKIYLQARLVASFDGINKFKEIVDEGRYIRDAGGDFQFQYGSSIANPDTRHPDYIDNYTPTGASDYQSNWLMNYMLTSKSMRDPRIQYYFYRQTSAIPNDVNLLECVGFSRPNHYRAVDSFCALPEGYWGRDHGDDAGTPPDSQSRTAFGVYPIGGRFDDGWFKVIAAIDQGGKGAGITPILLSSWVDFMRAEVAMVDGQQGEALAFMQSGLRKSFTKVRSFRALDAEERDISPGFLLDEPELTADENYIIELGEKFNAGNDQAKWNLLASEFFVTCFGNGIDPYNFYRRTGFPTDLQLNLEANPGGYIRSLLYPASFVNRNSTVNQKSSVTQRVFWDTNPETGFPEAN